MIIECKLHINLDKQLRPHLEPAYLRHAARNAQNKNNDRNYHR